MVTGKLIILHDYLDENEWYFSGIGHFLQENAP